METEIVYCENLLDGKCVKSNMLGDILIGIDHIISDGRFAKSN